MSVVPQLRIVQIEHLPAMPMLRPRQVQCLAILNMLGEATVSQMISRIASPPVHHSLYNELFGLENAGYITHKRVKHPTSVYHRGSSGISVYLPAQHPSGLGLRGFTRIVCVYFGGITAKMVTAITKLTAEEMASPRFIPYKWSQGRVRMLLDAIYSYGGEARTIEIAARLSRPLHKKHIRCYLSTMYHDGLIVASERKLDAATNANRAHWTFNLDGAYRTYKAVQPIKVAAAQELAQHIQIYFGGDIDRALTICKALPTRYKWGNGGLLL